MDKCEFRITLKTANETLEAGTLILEGDYGTLTPADAVRAVKPELELDDTFVQFREHLIPKADFRGLSAEVTCMWKGDS